MQPVAAICKIAEKAGSRYALAKAIGADPSWVYKLEAQRRDPKAGTIARCANAVGMVLCVTATPPEDAIIIDQVEVER